MVGRAAETDSLIVWRRSSSRRQLRSNKCWMYVRGCVQFAKRADGKIIVGVTDEEEEGKSWKISTTASLMQNLVLLKKPLALLPLYKFGAKVCRLALPLRRWNQHKSHDYCI